MKHEAGHYERLALDALADAHKFSDPGESAARSETYWTHVAHVYATLAVAAATEDASA